MKLWFGIKISGEHKKTVTVCRNTISSTSYSKKETSIENILKYSGLTITFV